MKDRISSFDYIRVMSFMGILLCHSCFQWQGTEWLGRYLAFTFNAIFILLSAFLIGLSWEKKEKPSYDKDFISHRVIRLAKSYYPYLIILFAFLLIIGENIPLHKILTYSLFLAWFDKIPGFGHVWYLTMILFCYIGIWLITQKKVISLISNRLIGGVF